MIKWLICLTAGNLFPCKWGCLYSNIHIVTVCYNHCFLKKVTYAFIPKINKYGCECKVMTSVNRPDPPMWKRNTSITFWLHYYIPCLVKKKNHESFIFWQLKLRKLNNAIGTQPMLYFRQFSNKKKCYILDTKNFSFFCFNSLMTWSHIFKVWKNEKSRVRTLVHTNIVIKLQLRDNNIIYLLKFSLYLYISL